MDMHRVELVSGRSSTMKPPRFGIFILINVAASAVASGVLAYATRC